MKSKSPFEARLVMSLDVATDGFFDALSIGKTGGVSDRSSAAYEKEPTWVIRNTDSVNLVSVPPETIMSMNIFLLDSLHCEKLKHVLHRLP
ncbi:hypothetical protein BG003_008963 [Podila horticola]|nr:hypothetical protein BG003_008963 [Podila horticola]